LSLEVTLFRKIYGKEHLMQLLLTYAVLLILDDACRLKKCGCRWRKSRNCSRNSCVGWGLAFNFIRGRAPMETIELDLINI
jgi:hypothetical protein